ncbi:MAG: hypothetical protein A2X64_11310 [Ignavibacteria bacterium GWF2_33_9]|nr:MAG: hypothetical protein A2X64_11310 [Ignavibacteria bacterium GWF2_33_9]
MKRLKNYILLFLLIFFVLSKLNAEINARIIIDTVKSNSDDRIKYGLIGGYSINYNTSDFRQLPGVDYFSPRFTSAEGNGYHLGICWESPLYKKSNLSYILKLYYANDKADFTKNNISKEFIDNSEIDAEINYQIHTSLDKLVYENLLEFRLFKNFNLLAGFNLGIFLGSHFEQKETLANPPNGKFANGSNVRHILSGEIKNLASLQSSASVGLNYDIKLGSKEQFIISPEILYSYSISNINTEIDWKYNSLRFDIALKYSPAPSNLISDFKVENYFDTLQVNTDTVKISYTKPGKEVIIRDTNKVKHFTTFSSKHYRTDTLFIPILFQYPELQVTYKENGTSHELKKIDLEEYLMYNQKPLLAYIFFDELSSSLPSRYKKLSKTQASNFNYKELFNSNTLDSYLNILNIIGYRLKQFPKAKITLIGSNSGVGEEMNNSSLSKERAETVSDYLTTIWGIEPSRIVLNFRNEPENPTSITDKDGEAENRRVEVISENPEITKFLGMIDTVRLIHPEIINIKLHNTNEQDKYFVHLRTDKTQEIPYQTDSPLSIKLDYPVNDALDSIYISASGTLKSIKNFQTESIAVPLHRTSNKIISDSGKTQFEVYNLILFDFNSSKLRNEQKSILDRIKARENEFISVKIFGYSDRIGNDEYNMTLSWNRAQEVAEYLNFRNTEIKSYGENQLIYDNTYPEGRFYSRTVIIELEKK